MKDTLKPGATSQFAFKVTAEKTVPHLYPEAPEFKEMPTVFATGFMVGLMEWTCMKVLEPHLEPGEGSLGVHIDVSHIAPTVPGQTVTVEATCTKVVGPQSLVRRQGPRRHRRNRRGPPRAHHRALEQVRRPRQREGQDRPRRQ